MKINIRKSAVKDLKNINVRDKNKIHQKILELGDFPNTRNIKKLTNFEPAFRLRVGKYRILFDVYDEVIEIGRVLHRKNSYR